MAFMAEKYSREQKEAAALAYVDRGIRPARRVVELAATGELEHNGEKLPAYDITADMVRHSGAQLRKQRLGQVKSAVADLPRRDGVEVFRRRLASYIDHELLRLERAQRKSRSDPKTAITIAQLVKTYAAIPDRDDPRPPAPGQKIPGAGNVTNGGKLAGEGARMLDAMRGPRTSVYTPDGDDPRQGASTEPAMAENAAQRSDAAHEPTQDSADDRPGAWMSEQVQRLRP
jgi:hypothetical protein